MNSKKVFKSFIVLVGIIVLFSTTLSANQLQSAIYSAPQEVTASVVSLPDANFNGNLDMTLMGNTVTNMLGNNGDFEEDINNDGFADGWKTGNPTGMSAQLTSGLFGQSAQRITSDGSTNSRAIVTNNYYSVNPNDKLYISSYIKGVSGNTNQYIGFLQYDSGKTFKDVVGSSIVPITGTYSKFSTLVTLRGDTSYVLPTVYVCFGTASNNVIDVDGMFVINLTQTFGSGKEPTLQECDQMFNYINSTKSTGPVRVKSVGKNLFDKNTMQANMLVHYATGLFENNQHHNITEYIKIKPNTNYTYSQSETYGHITFWDINKNYISGILTSLINQSFTTPSNANYIIISAQNQNYNTTNLDTAQLEEGSTATEYEPYKESVSYIPVELHSLPNGVADEVDLTTNVVTKRTKKYIFQGSDIIQIVSLANVALAFTAHPFKSDMKLGNDAAITGNTIIEGWQETFLNARDNTQNIGKYYLASDGTLAFIFPLWTPLTTAQAELAGKEVIYQLATPETQKINIPPLTAFEDGTVSVDHAAKKIAIYNDGITISNSNYPIKLIESVYKIDKGVKVQVDPSKIAVASNGLSFTINGAIKGECYEYIYNYESSLSTIPTIKFTTPMNLDAQIYDNTSMINDNSRLISDLLARIERLEEGVSDRLNVGPFTLACTPGAEFSLVLTASNSKDFSSRMFTVVYDPGELDIIDLCAATGTKETTVSNPAGTNISITNVDTNSGLIEFIVNAPIEEGQTWSGAVNTIVFKPKANINQATISYTAD